MHNLVKRQDVDREGGEVLAMVVPIGQPELIMLEGCHLPAMLYDLLSAAEATPFM